MKRIRKTHPPKEFLEWIQKRRAADQRCNYKSLSGSPHIKLKEHLLKEQGYICAYTGIRIKKESSHIEHLKPQTQCTDDETIDYYNVVACFPMDGGDTSYGFGAPLNKGDSWKEGEMVSPCDAICETKFSFSWKGKVFPADKDDEVAIKTISRLGLDSQGLRDRRYAAIKVFFGFSSNPRVKKLDKQTARRRLEEIYRQDSSNQFVEYCFVIRQLLYKHIK
jgi:uncharacterized protein (TIGR02646 family)